MRLTHDVVPCDRGIAYVDEDVTANRIQYGSRRRGRRGQDDISRSPDFYRDLVKRVRGKRIIRNGGLRRLMRLYGSDGLRLVRR